MPDPTAIAVFTLAVGVFLHLFKSPKEVNGELTQALRSVTKDHELLARRFERHDAVVQNLTSAVERLTTRIDKIEPYLAKQPNGRRGT